VGFESDGMIFSWRKVMHRLPAKPIASYRTLAINKIDKGQPAR